MIEGDFSNQLKRSFERDPRIWHHAPYNIAKGQVKPCDIIMVWMGFVAGIEVKLHKSRFSLEELKERNDVVLKEADFRPTQLPSLRRMRDRHVLPLIVLGVYDAKRLNMKGFVFTLRTFEKYSLSLPASAIGHDHDVFDLERVPMIQGWKIPAPTLEHFFCG